MSDPFALGDIPTIGDTYHVKADWHTVVIECQCDAKRTLILTQPKQALRCSACGRSFAILNEADVSVAEVVLWAPALTDAN